MILNQMAYKKCERHKMMDISLATLSTKYSEGLYCSVCMLKERLHPQALISIPELISQPLTLPIQNWPYGIDQNSLDYLSQLLSINKKEQIRTDINLFFKDFHSQVFQVIEDQREKILLDLEQCSAVQSDLIEFYNEKFKRKELISLLSNPEQFSKEDYFSLLQGLDSSKAQDLVELSQRKKTIEKIEEDLNKGYFQQVKQITLELIQNIQLISTPSSTKMNEQYNANNQQNNSSFENRAKCIAQIIIENLQNNSDIKSELEQYEQQKKFDKIFKNLQPEEDKKKKQDSLEKNEYQNILSSSHGNVKKVDLQKTKNKQGHDQDEKNNNIQALKKQIDELYIEYSQKQQQNEQQDQQQQQLQQGQNNTANKIKFIKSNYSWSDLVEVGVDNVNNNVFINSGILNNLFASATVFSNNLLNPTKSYTIRFLFNQPYFQIQDRILIGLLENSNLNNTLLASNIFFDNQLKNSFFRVKGNLEKDSPDKETIKEIEIRVCLEKNMILYSDYPNYNYVFSNSISPKQNENYRFGVSFSCNSQNRNVTITHFEESNSFIPF